MLRSPSSPEFTASALMNLMLIISILLLVAGFACAGIGFKNLEHQFDSDTLNVERIEEATPGLAEVSGEVALAQESLTALFSDETCVVYGIVVEEKHQQGDGPLWQVSSSAQNGVPFYLKDDTGSILVDPLGIELDLSEKNVLEVPNGVVPPDPIRTAGEELRENDPEWVANLDVNKLTCQTSRDTRFYEFYLEPGEECSVFGSVLKRDEARNACYDDGDSCVIFQTDSTPEFVLSETPLGDDLEVGFAVTSWMITAAAFLTGGMLIMAASLS